jgi:hypothetical protein
MGDSAWQTPIDGQTVSVLRYSSQKTGVTAEPPIKRVTGMAAIFLLVMLNSSCQHAIEEDGQWAQLRASP